MSVICFTLGSS